MGGWQRFVVGGAIINATLWMGVGSILMLHNGGEGAISNQHDGWGVGAILMLHYGWGWGLY